MNPNDTLRMALDAIARNKSRSVLTALGIVIGVAAVMAMVAIGEGARQRVQAAFASMGSNVLVVGSGSSSAGGLHGGSGSIQTLTWEDLRAMAGLPSVAEAAPQLKAPVQAVSAESNWGTTAFGVTPEYFDIRSWAADDGQLLSKSDVDGAANVAVLGQTVAYQLFGTSSRILGRIIQVGGLPFTVLGVAEPKGQSASGHDYDDAVFVPVTTYTSKIQRGLQQYLGGVIYVAATSSEDSDAAQQEIASLLRERHHIGSGQEDDFSIRSLAEVAAAREEGTRTMTLLLASIAGVSLLVGGIGIMNIMLVSVAERTREIGLRMAIGAHRGAILAQFLAEALVLAALGGLGGVVLGVVAAEQLANRLGWPVSVRADIALISVLFSGLVGVVFGLYPARKASLMHPVEALRYE